MKISNFKFHISNKYQVKLDIGYWKLDIGNFSGGYTLIELLVSVGVMVTVGTILGSIIFSSLRGANKTNSISAVRQNGNFAISQMSKMIRDARAIDYPCVISSLTPTPPPPAVRILSQDGRQTIFNCTATTIASNGASIIDSSSVNLVPGSCSFTCARTSVGDVPTIGISFSLRRNAGNVLEQQAVIPFQTTVTQRATFR